MRPTDFLLLQIVQSEAGAHLTSCSVGEALSPSMKRPGRESDNSPPSSAKVKNDWKYSATYIFMACARADLLLVYRVRKNIFFSLFLLLSMENLMIPLADVIFKFCK